MKKLLPICFLFVGFLASAQDNTNGCIFIDFEQINGMTPQDGMVISDQFRNAFGLVFRLENGGSPVLAEVGGRTTAFSSSWGSDAPAPGVDLGRFFLTDDGRLSGLQAPPVILEFDTPIDSFSGCIIDMDFDERFVIEVLDQTGQPIIQDTISAGDPGTGDGLATCWGFDLPGCEGEIYSIKFSGFRTDFGGFGLGLDSFSFCYTGLHVNIETNDPTCIDTLGSILIRNTRSEVYEYSLDGTSFTPNGFFPGLVPGIYDVFIMDAEGCQTSLEVEVRRPVDPEITDASVDDTSCGEDNGSIEVFASGSVPRTYSLDGIGFQDETSFDSLSAGSYLVRVVDSNGCQDSIELVIDPSIMPLIDTILTTPDLCRDSSGTLSVLGASGNGNLTYSIDGFNFQQSNQFGGLQPGPYTAFVRDEQGCLGQIEGVVETTDSVRLSDLQIQAPSCDFASGGFSFEASGGTGQLTYSINGGPSRLAPSFGQLDAGNYLLNIVDEIGCSWEYPITLPLPICPVYVPNVFTPNRDGVNETFQIFTNSRYDVDVLSYSIFDRWGELLYRSNNFTILTGDQWWDGTFKGEEMMVGVYVYLIEVQHNNGLKEVFAGDVTLVR
ncbi:MAG: gliding motility-associated C-terminal domain-containing protein [Bacteroidota bacterium]